MRRRGVEEEPPSEINNTRSVLGQGQGLGESLDVNGWSGTRLPGGQAGEPGREVAVCFLF